MSFLAIIRDVLDQLSREFGKRTTWQLRVDDTINEDIVEPEFDWDEEYYPEPYYKAENICSEVGIYQIRPKF